MLGAVEQTIIFFPLMRLKQAYQLKYGHIGPVANMLPEYPALEKIIPALARVTVDGKSIKKPVVAVSTSSYPKFVGEIECLAFLAASGYQSLAEEEIFCQRITVTMHNNGQYICVNHYATMLPEQLYSIKLQDFPKAYFQWDTDLIRKFESFFKKALRTKLYSAITECLSDVADKEAQRERSRIIISIALFNQAFIDFSLVQPFSKNCIVLVAAAFEALLNLPAESIQSSFQNAVQTLVGKRTSLLKKWCVDFYNYRSGLVHGDIAWESNKEGTFNLPGKKQVNHDIVARHLFVYCMKSKLFLMGLLTGYKREDFNFDAYVGS